MKNLLIIGCSFRKHKVDQPTPALNLYDGINYRIIHKLFKGRGKPEDLSIQILSAKYGLIDSMEFIENYDWRMDKNRGKELQTQVRKKLEKLKFEDPKKIFVNLGKDYMIALSGYEKIFQNSIITIATGGIGMKISQMKNGLEVFILLQKPKKHSFRRIQNVSKKV